MAEEETAPLPPPLVQPPPPAQPPPPPPPPAQPPLQPPVAPPADPSPSPPKFDPSRMIGIIKRKALIKDLAAVYHAECLDYCQELLELQRKWEESQTYTNIKPSEDSRKDIARPSKRMKKSRREQA